MKAAVGLTLLRKRRNELAADEIGDPPHGPNSMAMVDTIDDWDEQIKLVRQVNRLVDLDPDPRTREVSDSTGYRETVAQLDASLDVAVGTFFEPTFLTRAAIVVSHSELSARRARLGSIKPKVHYFQWLRP